jgi:hypothetical protein
LLLENWLAGRDLHRIPGAAKLKTAFNRRPFHKVFAADRGDHGDRGNDDGADNQSVFENFAAVVVSDQCCHGRLESPHGLLLNYLMVKLRGSMAAW